MNIEPMELVRAAVIAELEGLAPRYAGRISDDDRLLADLKLTGDDATAFVLLAAKRLKIKVPPRAWDHVYTVGDAIGVLMSHLPPQDTKSSG